MKAALIIVLSLLAVASAGPAINKNQNQINQQASDNKAYQQEQQHYMSGGDFKQTQATETLKQWCFSSQMSQPELTASFKKLVNIVKSSPEDQSTEAAVMSERICQGALVQKSAQSGETIANTGADAQAHELIKDVYMDALIACESRQCMQQLIKIINSNQVDTIRASYYMTRVAVTEKDQIKDDADVKQLAESFIGQGQSASEAIERQKLFAVTSLLAKQLEKKTEGGQQQQQQQVSGELKQITEQVAKTIVERYIRPVSQQEVEQYRQQQPQQQSSQVAKKIAKRNAALKALANIPGWILKDIKSVEQTIMDLVNHKHELVTVRQSAIECLEQNEQAQQELQQITFDQEEPIEVRVAAYRALMTTVFAGTSSSSNMNNKQQVASQIVEQVIRHCENQRNQQQDDQFVMYAVSHLNNLRTSQQPEYQAIKETITKNKQHNMQIQLLQEKFQQQLSDVRKSSRNYKLEQEFNQLESGLIIEGDLIYESQHKQQQQQQQQQPQILPKLIRVNMSMPVMGETVNVVEITLRQNQMDEELLSTLKLVQGAKFNSESMSKVVDSFKSSAVQSHQHTGTGANKQQATAEADLTIKVEGSTIVYLCVDDFKSSQQQNQQTRNTRSVSSAASIVDEIIEHLKRKPVAFNRGFNFNLNQRLAKVLDVDANIIAGLRFNSRAQGQSSKDFEIVAQVEPRFAFEAIVGPAKMSSKKLLQRVSTKTALGLRLRFKQDELVDVQVDLPMNTMELFTVESQMVEKSATTPYSYTYLPESIYGQEDIYTSDEDFEADSDNVEGHHTTFKGLRKMKRSIFEKNSSSSSSSIVKKFVQSGKQQQQQGTFAQELETPIEWARATGLRSKLRVVASPKDMSFLVQCVAQKYEPRMQGYRVQVQKSKRAADVEQFVFTISTPGSTIDRTMQVRVVKQTNSQRTTIKSDIQSPLVAASSQYELIHDGRQYAIRAEMAASRFAGKQVQWRHKIESGVQRAQSQAGRIATTYKPYFNLESCYLKRPVQMQGVLSYQTTPKSVISYELRSSNSKDFVQGKIILDDRSSNENSQGKRGSRQQQPSRRSMQSPLESFLRNDLTLTSEFVGQVEEHAVKVHQMIDWDSSKWAVNADYSRTYKNLRKSDSESQVTSQLQVDQHQTMLTVQRNCPQQEQDNFRFTLNSNNKQQGAHQLSTEFRYNSGLKSVVAYKHKVDYSTKQQGKQLELAYQVELISSEHQLNKQIQGRTQVQWEPKMKTYRGEMSSGNESGKLNVEFVSMNQHQIELVYQGERVQHKGSIRSDKRQYSLQSITQQDQQMVAKLVLEVEKQQPGECQLIVELPVQKCHIAADLKLAPGKLSSLAVKSPRFATKAEFAFEAPGSAGSRSYIPVGGLRFKSDLKDLMNQEQYWIDSAYNKADKQSYFRFNSPAYRTDLEYSPRDESTKWGLFARSKRSVGQQQQLYSNDDSILSIPSERKLDLGNKLWMVRSIVSSPAGVEQLKRQARRALFEYADRRQSQRHSMDWQPSEERVQFAFNRQPNTDYKQQQHQVEPMSFTGDLGTDFFGQYYGQQHQQQQKQRPSTLSMNTQWVDFDAEAKPYDGEESYARLSALSRNRRSAFKKHESEIRYNKHNGYKAWMKHQDGQEQRHQWQLEADQKPMKYAKMTYESDKHGKGQYEHQWRKQLSKRSHKTGQQQQQQQDDQVYQNKIAFKAQSPIDNKWSHSTQMQWEEPEHMMAGNGRVRRSASDKYNTIDYLKHVNARLQSQTSRDQAELYNFDFDYQPTEHYGRLNINMPEDLVHSSSFEYQPSERLYKLQSRLYNGRTQVPSYELIGSTKPIMGLATAEQEPMFFSEQHPMYDQRQASSGYYNTLSSFFKQPMKVDYTDKYGRVASLDYDHSPLNSQVAKYQGLRQKRAALFYKDHDFEHQSSYDFYPEALVGFKPSKRVPGDFQVKAETKYGPIVMHIDSDEQTTDLYVKSPVFNAKLTAQSSASSKRSQLIKLTLDNKQQSVKLTKIIRQTPVLKDCQLVKDLAAEIDQSRFEHQTELLVSQLEAIFKVKSQTMLNQRTVMLVEGEMNKAQNKAIVKVDGERVYGQLVVDLVTKSADLSLDCDDKRTFQHQTRLVRVNDKFFTLDSMTSYKQQPLFKLSGKVSAMILSEPEHFFSSRRQQQQQQQSRTEEHISTFDAVVYEPKEMHISGKYDCLKKEARVIVKDAQTSKTTDVIVQYDDRTENVHVNARSISPRGVSYSIKKTINMTPYVSVY